MADNTYPIKKSASGSISGFDSISLSGDPSISETNQSLTQVIALLQNIINTQGIKHIKQIEQMSTRHVRNFKNPHNVTLDQLTDDIPGGFLGNYLTGTAPIKAPTVSIQTIMEYPEALYPASCSRASALNIIDRQGFITYIGNDTLGVDWSTGYPIIPCWPATTQYIPVLNLVALNQKNYVTFNGLELSSSYTPPSGLSPDGYANQATFVEDTVLSQKSITFDFTTLSLSSDANYYTFSVFFFPIVEVGSFYLSAIDTGLNTQTYCIYDVDTKTVTTDPNVASSCCVLANGWVRLGLTFAYNSSDPIPNITLGYTKISGTGATYNDMITSGRYVGRGQSVFIVYGPQLTQGTGMAPFISEGDSLAASTLTFSGFPRAIPLDTYMMGVSYSTFSPSKFLNNEHYTEYLLSSGTQIAFTHVVTAQEGDVINTTVPLSNSTLTVQSSVVYNGFNTSGMSYNTSFSKLLTKTNLDQKVQTTADIPLGSLDTFSVGPFKGGLCSFTLYPIDDQNSDLEFILDAGT